MTAPELSRPQPVRSLGTEPRALHVTADGAERAALAERFGLLSLDRLAAEVTLSGDGAVVQANGRVRAEVRQSCVATGEPVPARIDEPFAIRFVPEDTAVEDEAELSEDECDIVFYAGGEIDVGEAVAETMALALDPFPRSPEAEAALREAGVLSQEEARPLGPLAGLRDQLVGK